MMLLLFFIVATFAAPSGLEVGVGEAGLQFVAAQISSRVIPHLGTLAIPAIPKSRFSCAGKCYLEIEGGSMSDLRCPTPSLSLAPPATVSAAVSGCSLAAKVKWKLHRSTFPGFSCSGTVDISFSGVGFAASIAVARAPTGAIAFSVAGAHASLSSDRMDFHGDCELLANAAKQLLEKQVRNTVNKELSGKLPGMIEAELAKWSPPLSFPIKELPGVALSLTLADAPVASAQALALDVTGLFSFKGQAPGVLCGGATSAPPAPAGFYVRAAARDCALNSFASALYNGNFLQRAFNYTVLGVEFDVAVLASQAPTVHFSPAGALVNASATMNLTSGVNGTGFGLQMVASAPLAMRFAANNVLTGTLGDVDILDLSLTFNTYNMSLAVAKVFLQEALNSIVVASVNDELKKGYQLPAIFGVHFAQEALLYADGWAEASTRFVK